MFSLFFALSTFFYTSFPDGHVMPNRLDRTGWKAMTNTYENDYEAQKAIDGDNGSFWISQYSSGTLLPSGETICIYFDLQEPREFASFSLLTKQNDPQGDNNRKNGRIQKYKIYVGNDTSVINQAKKRLNPEVTAQSRLGRSYASFAKVSAVRLSTWSCLSLPQ